MLDRQLCESVSQILGYNPLQLEVRLLRRVVSIYESQSPADPYEILIVGHFIPVLAHKKHVYYGLLIDPADRPQKLLCLRKLEFLQKR